MEIPIEGHLRCRAFRFSAQRISLIMVWGSGWELEVESTRLRVRGRLGQRFALGSIGRSQEQVARVKGFGSRI